MVDCRTCEHYHAEFTDVLSIRVWCDAYNDSTRMMNSLDCKKFKPNIKGVLTLLIVINKGTITKIRGY